MRRTRLTSLTVTLLALSGGGTLTASPVQQGGEANFLVSVAGAGFGDTVKRLLDEGADVNARDEHGQTALMAAAYNGRTEVVNLLLEYNADVNVVADTWGRTALHLAAVAGHTEVVSLLLEHGAEINATAVWGLTPLMEAAYRGHTEVVKLLLEHGADVNIVADTLGITASSRAASAGHTEVVNLLLEHGAEPSRVSVDRPVFTPFTVSPEIKDRTRAVEIVIRNYPKELQDAGISGTVSVWIFIDTNGRVQNALVHESSGHEALDAAALAAAREFEFTPALNNDEVVPVWVRFPITFEVPREP